MFSDDFPQLDILNKMFNEKYPFMASTVSNGYTAFGNPWAYEIEELLNKMFPSPDMLSNAVDGYVRFAMDVTRRQSRFDDEGAYPQKSFAQVADEVYLNHDYMERYYLPGLLLSHLLWPHHFRQSRFFVANFLADMKIKGAGSFVDAGVGTGFLSRLTLATCSDITGIGFDVSPASQKFAQLQVANYKLADRYQCKLLDLCKQPTGVETDWLISAEVLEHLEEPLVFLQKLRAILRPGGKGFITAAINAAEIDHIYLYRNAKEVEEQLVSAGFIVEQYQVIPAYKPRKEDIPPPEVVAFIVN
ncbi:MAG: class I SAM-dependent methyltransferase [Magnetococcales bacterium]|nr:class I SAM-dependent methyltransferase [Magnetococcales bacterium]